MVKKHIGSAALKTNAITLALHGGPKTRTQPWPERHSIGPEEKAAVNALFDESIRSGKSIGYGGPAEDAYCRDFVRFMGGGYADAVNSGTTAVYIALRALNLEPFFRSDRRPDHRSRRHHADSADELHPHDRGCGARRV